MEIKSASYFHYKEIVVTVMFDNNDMFCKAFSLVRNGINRNFASILFIGNIYQNFALQHRLGTKLLARDYECSIKTSL